MGVPRQHIAKYLNGEVLQIPQDRTFVTLQKALEAIMYGNTVTSHQHNAFRRFSDHTLVQSAYRHARAAREIAELPSNEANSAMFELLESNARSYLQSWEDLCR